MTDHSDLIAVRCEGCGSAWTGADLARERAANPRLLSCCPERKPLTIDQWRARAEAQSLSLSEARAENDRKDAEIERLKKLSDRYVVALMMIRAGCSDPARFAGNILDDRQPVNVELDEEDFDENHR